MLVITNVNCIFNMPPQTQRKGTNVEFGEKSEGRHLGLQRELRLYPNY
jgi:hypothetical protein